MGFRHSEKFKKEQEEIYNSMVVYFGEETKHVTEFEDRSITPKMREKMRMNSYAQDKLPQKLTNEALINEAKQYKSHCGKPSRPTTTYDEALIHVILPELIKRLEEVE
ncbi:hypothetical protein 015DV002_169 [Bacillus phage 015DV002]|nr:hypothetical protein 015DV002_169 [Bacillus phage 015DV002]